MKHTGPNLRRASVRLQYDGRTHVVGNQAQTWDVRFELERLGAGEVVGVGSVATARDASDDGVNGEVVLSGRIDAHGVASITLTPLARVGGAPITLVARVSTGLREQHDPIIAEVISVRGLPL